MYSLNKIKGLIYGSAIGDSIGFISEYKSRSDLNIFINEFFKGKLKTITHRTYPKDYKFGQYSDDTQFSILLLEHFLKYRHFNSQKYFSELKDLYSKNQLIGLGSNTRKLLSGDSINTTNSSNGSLMRSYPVGLFFQDKNEILFNARLQSMMSHNHQEAISACQCYSIIISQILKDSSKETLKDELKNYVNINILSLSFDDFISFVQKNYYRKNWEYIAPGATVTLYAALYSYYNSNNFKDCLKIALSLGGDTDTVASLSCGLAGVTYGFNSIPKEWITIPYDENNIDPDILNRLSNEIFHYLKKL